MFNKTIHNTESKVVAVTQVVEKTISPDKVTDMYDKVKEQVERDFVRAFKIETDTVNGIVVEFENKFDTMERILMSRFVLNGKEYIMKCLKQSSEMFSDQELYDVFSNHYASEFATLVMKPTADTLMKGKK